MTSITGSLAVVLAACVIGALALLPWLVLWVCFRYRWDIRGQDDWMIAFTLSTIAVVFEIALFADWMRGTLPWYH